MTNRVDLLVRELETVVPSAGEMVLLFQVQPRVEMKVKDLRLVPGIDPHPFRVTSIAVDRKPQLASSVRTVGLPAAVFLESMPPGTLSGFAVVRDVFSVRVRNVSDRPLRFAMVLTAEVVQKLDS